MANEDKNMRLANSFRLELDGIDLGEFDTVEIGKRERSVIEHRTGTDPQHMTVSLGLEKPVTIVVGKAPREYDADIIKTVEEWYDAGDSQKKGGRIDALDKEGETFYAVIFEDAVCSDFQPPKFDSTAEEKATFTFTITAPRLIPAA